MSEIFFKRLFQVTLLGICLIMIGFFNRILIAGETQTITLAENTPISDIPSVSYILRSAETEIIPVIPAFVDIDPDTLNFKSQGKWITAYIELPKGYDINQIDLNSIRLNNQIPIESRPITIADYDNNGNPDLMVKFNRKAVQNILQPGEKVKITISGKLNNNQFFEGSDVIRIINAKTTALLLFPVLLGLTVLLNNKREKFKLSGKNKPNKAEGKTIIWVIVLIVVLLSLGLSVYQWQRIKTELIAQIKKSDELAKKFEAFKESNNCIKKIPSPIEFGFQVILTSFQGDITLTRPDGSGKVGRWWDSEEQEFRWAEEGLGGTAYGVVNPGNEDKFLSVGVFSGMMPRDEGDFLVEVLRRPDTLPTDTYTLELWVGGEIQAVLAENVLFGNFPKHLYIIRSTEEGISVINPNICKF